MFEKVESLPEKGKCDYLQGEMNLGPEKKMQQNPFFGMAENSLSTCNYRYQYQ